MLEPLGISELEEATYHLLLQRAERTAAEVADGLATTTSLAARNLRNLRRLGLAEPAGEPGATDESRARWTAVPPDIAVESLVLRREDELRRARGRISELMRAYREGGGGTSAAGLVDLVAGQPAITKRWRQMRMSARCQVLVFDKPPYIGAAGSDVELELGTLHNGVAWLAMYEYGAVSDASRLEEISRLARGGERGRMLAELPFKLAVVDRERALVPVYEGAELDTALVVRPSFLLDALLCVFELYWAKGMPIPSGVQPADPGNDPTDRQLLTLLAAGLTDESIGRQLGVSARTVQRRLRTLMAQLNAQTRFQAGVQAARAGLL